jgi:glycosyltransferase involved in cell wall biosynthesis
LVLDAPALEDTAARSGGPDDRRSLRVNVLFLNSSRRWGGTEAWVGLAMRSLADRAGVFLACRNKDLWQGRLGERAVLERLPFAFEADPVTIAGLVRLIRRHAIDLVVPTKRKDYCLAGIASRLTGIRNVIRLGIVRPVGGRPADRLVYGRWADGFVVNAAAIRDALSESPFIPKDRVRVVYNGVEADAVRERAAAFDPGLPGFRFTISSVGELSGRKGVLNLIRGFAEFRKSVPDPMAAGLLLVGDGPERPALEAAASELGVADSVVFAGFRENPHPFVARSDAFVMASRNEGISNALLEAMALGRPVITTAAGGAAEVVRDGENGIVLHDGSAEAIGNAIRRLYFQPAERDRLGKAGRATALERCSPARMADELLEFFSEVMGN